jgi:hypothetical protein
MTHAAAWRLAARRKEPTLVVEADFVPVIGIGRQPFPLPEQMSASGIAYLYSCGPEIWDLSGSAIARGHSGAMVALVIPPAVAGLLLEFYGETMNANPDGVYTTWDSKIGYWLNKRGIECFLPYRQYGEHGGIWNPEHKGRAHRADVLAAPLRFLPPYARGSALTFLKTRIRARWWGVLRLCSGRFLRLADFKRSRKGEMLRFVVGRQFFGKP